MTSCETYQSQLLAYMYDLLEETDRQQLQAHLETCDGCKAALARAQNQKRLLALAAKAEFPKVRFQPPVEETAPRERETVPLVRPEPRSVRSWAIAAGILLLVGLGVPSGWWTVNYTNDQARASAERQRLQAVEAEELAVGAQFQEKLALANRELEKSDKEIRELDGKHNEKLAALQRKIEQEQIDLRIIGPTNFQPGAPNRYSIQTMDLGNQAVAANVDTRVVNQEKKVLYEEKNVASQGEYQVVLPPNLPLAPRDRLALVVSARRNGGPAGEVREELPLAAPTYITHLATDKPMYRPGETVHFRSLTLERFTLKAVQEDLHLSFTITNPNGEEIFHADGSSVLVTQGSQAALVGPDKKPIRGIGAGEFRIQEALPGGEYTLTVRESNQRFPEQQRKFLVNKYENPRLNKELDFTRKSYGPGEEVVAACKVARAEGGTPVANRRVEATIHIDGKPYRPDGQEGAQPIVLQTDDKGAVTVRFKLPPVIERGLGTLSVQFTDGASVETLVKPIPIVVKKLQLEFFPEGGDLVRGVPIRVYFQARTMLGKPAEIQGRVVDQSGNVAVDNVQTLNDDHEPGVNQGMGVFTFTPETGRKYELKIDAPGGIEGKYALPDTKPDGVVLSVGAGVTAATEPIRVTVRTAGADRSLLIGAYCRGRLMDHRAVAAKQGEATEVMLQPGQEVGGVYRITVFEELPGQGNRPQLKPVAERLVYRAPARQLLLTAKPDKPRYIPGDKVNLSITGLNEKEQPTGAIVMVAAVDKSVITMADEKTARTMPTHFYLTTEVRRPEDLEYADFLLTANPKAPAALDLLLGTQGWRRFAEQDPGMFQQRFGQDADRLLTANGQGGQRATALMQPEVERLNAEFVKELAALQGRETEKRRELETVRDELQQRMQVAAAQSLDARRAYFDASARVDADKEMVKKTLGNFLAPLLVAVSVALIICLAVAMRGRVARAVPYYATAAVCGMLVIGLSAVLLWNAEQHGPGGATAEMVTNATRDGALPAGEARVYAKMAAPAMQPHPEAAKAEAPVPPMEVAQAGEAGDAKANAEARLGEAVKRDGMLIRENDKAGGRNEFEGLGKRQLAQQANPQGLPKRNVAKDTFPVKKQLVGGRPINPMLGEMRAVHNNDRPAQRAANKSTPAEFRKRFVAAPTPEPPPPPFVVREYAHQQSPGSSGEPRNDFVDTLYWHPALVLADGKADVSFDLCDSITSYQVLVFGHTLDGRLGAVTTNVEARLPMTLEPKLPIEVTAGDKIDVPVSIANNTNDARTIDLHLSTAGLNIEGNADTSLKIDAEGRARRLFRLEPSVVEGPASVHVEGSSAPFTDKVTRTFYVVPQGFPVVASHSDMLERVARQDIVLPETWVKGTLKCQVQVYPSTLADLQKGLEALLREPGGCFEQTSSSNYPNLLVLDYLKQSDQTKPELERRARDLLASGYQKLVSFECQEPAKNKREGYEWFGGVAAPHEALTAYGLLEFRDMARVYDVDMKMVDRTRDYLMSRRDGKGGFQRNPRALDSFGRAPDAITNAYIVWALTESGKEDVSRELAALAGQAKDSKDPYFLALVALSLVNRGQAEEGTGLLKKVAAAQQGDGHLDASTTSITGSGGRDLQIETTALAVLGWLKANRPADFNPPLQKAIRWIGQQRGGYGGFGSTQSTILALKALIAFTIANKKTAEGGELRLSVGGQALAQLEFAAGAQDALVLALPEAEKRLRPGKNTVDIEVTGKNVFPYTLTWSYQTLKPASADGCPVRLQTHLDRATASEGETVHLTVTVENSQDKGQGMAVAIVGLPAGLTLPEDMKQLKDHARLRDDGKEKGLISAWETRGREVILYWRDLAPKQKIEVPLDLICRVPGEYSGPASRAYLYYNADLKHWVEPLRVTIKGKDE
jgi:hypothetical protein